MRNVCYDLCFKPGQGLRWCVVLPRAAEYANAHSLLLPCLPSCVPQMARSWLLEWVLGCWCMMQAMGSCCTL